MHANVHFVIMSIHASLKFIRVDLIKHASSIWIQLPSTVLLQY